MTYLTVDLTKKGAKDFQLEKQQKLEKRRNLMHKDWSRKKDGVNAKPANAVPGKKPLATRENQELQAPPARDARTTRDYRRPGFEEQRDTHAKSKKENEKAWLYDPAVIAALKGEVVNEPREAMRINDYARNQRAVGSASVNNLDRLGHNLRRKNQKDEADDKRNLLYDEMGVKTRSKMGVPWGAYAEDQPFGRSADCRMGAGGGFTPNQREVYGGTRYKGSLREGSVPYERPSGGMQSFIAPEMQDALKECVAK